MSFLKWADTSPTPDKEQKENKKELQHMVESEMREQIIQILLSLSHMCKYEEGVSLCLRCQLLSFLPQRNAGTDGTQMHTDVVNAYVQRRPKGIYL